MLLRFFPHRNLAPIRDASTTAQESPEAFLCYHRAWGWFRMCRMDRKLPVGDEFLRLVRDEPVQLERVALECARDVCPRVLVEPCLDRLDQLAARVEVPFALPPLTVEERRQMLEAIARLLYRQEGFRGTELEDYYNPQNSLLNRVLARRVGIPLTLGLIYRAVAVRLGLDVFAVSTPGHFMLGCQLAGRRWYIDPFNQGELLDQADCRRRVEEMSGPQQWSPACFRRASHRQVIARLLRNLKNALVMEDRWAQALLVQQRLLMLYPHHEAEQRDMGLILLRNGEPHSALEYLQRYQHQHPDEAEMLRPCVKAARRLAAEMN